MLDRRQFTTLVVSAGALAGAAPGARAAAQLGDDGLYHQPWFMETFLELGDDLAESAAAGKRLAVIWEQRGCPYCRDLHLVNLARPEIRDFIRARFGVVQLNLWGAREVTDFDGEVLEERALARRWRVNFTPTVQFFPESLEAVGGRPGVDCEVARMPGYFKPLPFLTMFEYVAERAYREVGFQRYLRERLARLEAQGIDPERW